MFKRFLCLVVLIPFVLACLPVFYASADNFESWVIVDFRTSQDGINWSSRKEIQLLDGAFWYDASQNYIKIDRVRVLDTSNNPSDIFISFSFNIHPYIFTNVTSTGTFSGTQSVEWSSTASYDGYFRSRQNQYLVESPNDFTGLGRGTFLVGQYHLPDTTGSTAFTLTPNSDVYYGFTYSSSTASGICISITNVNCVFVGNDGMLYDIHQDLTNIKALMNQWYSSWNDFYNDFQYYLDFCENTLLPFLNDWYDGHMYYLDFIYNNLHDLWSQFYQGTYSYYSFSSQGTNSFVFNSRFATAINNNLLYQNSLLNSLNQRGWNYIKISLNENNNQMESSEQSGSWWQAILGAFTSSNAIDEHEIALENEALEAGAGDLYDEALSDIGDSYSGLGYLFGLKALRNLFNFSEWSSNSLSIISGWFTQENSNNINGTPGRAPEETVIDFVSHNSDLDWFGDHGE